MIARLCGILVEKEPPFLLIEVQGVGYEVLAPVSTCLKLAEPPNAVTVHTHFVVREDAHQLYAFYAKTDRDLFRELIRVNSVGPKLALAILSAMDPATFISKVVGQEVNALVAVPGVGRKTAERLVIEMRDKLSNWPVDFVLSAAEQRVPIAPSEEAIAIQALIRLGYKAQEAEKAVARCALETKDSAQLIRKALQCFAQG